MTTAPQDHPASCATPIGYDALADYWAGGLASPEEEAVELHLLECDSCGARLRGVIDLAEGIRTMAREGRLRMVVSDTLLERAAQHGAQVRQYMLPAGGSVQCTVSAEDDIVVGRLAADVSGTSRVDLCLCDEHGVEQHRMSDIPVRTGSAEVIYQESIARLKAWPTLTLIGRLVAVDADGAERVLGEFTFHHTRTLPGPGALS